ncbi:Na+/H+ antiporter subunit G [Microvirga tunisiensis]|uniref:Na+/H+ antiporter subunit G n=2 Tax=Pannonibacter tanglangensis TaxID=2750084 RepID=A0A7X5J8G8_9HYPH|nr:MULTISPECIES: monovalent cation/H(+) antiporter subunit G [unclassified Pannonibacter]NBN62925.1 Na+/H+ antiporter subunit G [Pannonibacter sp. XCT-34]NBN78497.1 Na+/H+ antiporter subunit G [Pannonibacter sp. XCT-53]
MSAVIDIIIGLMLVVGAIFALLAAIGVLRFPDVYTRMHAASKAGTVGSSLMLLALAFDAGQLDVITRAVAGVLFFLLTAPISAHLLAKAAFTAGYPPCAAMNQEGLRQMLGKTGKPKA